ncbi:MAG: DUF6653 family protein [Pseudomonadota bacterium]
MNLYAAAERLMGMNDAVWARHANPWSVWTRFSCLPLIVLAVWWRSWGLLALVLAWTWVNPRAFPAPAHFDHWASRAVLGERLFLSGADIPRHHLLATRILSALSAVGLIPLCWGLYTLDPVSTVLGTLLAVMPKVWFCDRMVWILADLTGNRPGMALPGPQLPPLPPSDTGATR